MAEGDLEVIRRGYAAFIAGDLEAVRGLFAEDATWEVPGSNPTSGTKQGRDAIIGYLVQIMTLSEGTFTTTQLDLAQGDEHVFSLDRIEATRNGVTVNNTGINVFQLQDGLVSSVRQYAENTAELDAFWA
jgi:ketosteroid isomerase-like protein